MPKIYSVGHSNKPIEKLVELLLKNEINMLVDVRTYPYSKYNPQFNKNSLIENLENAGIKYTWRGKNLGGLGKNTLFNETIAEMLKVADEIKICVMCSEADPGKCHRTETIEPEVNRQGSTMKHILWDGSVPNNPEYMGQNRLL